MDWRLPALNTTESPNASFSFACRIATLAESKKSDNTAILDVSQISGFADFFVFATGHSSTQIRAISGAIAEGLKREGVVALHTEEDLSGQWHVLDYGDVVVHIMQESARQQYDLESYWSHGIPKDGWQQRHRQSA
ncbi:MAG: ribosome silencing factor [Vampirovibrionales bacterium]